MTTSTNNTTVKIHNMQEFRTKYLPNGMEQYEDLEESLSPEKIGEQITKDLLTRINVIVAASPAKSRTKKAVTSRLSRKR